MKSLPAYRLGKNGPSLLALANDRLVTSPKPGDVIELNLNSPGTFRELLGWGVIGVEVVAVRINGTIAKIKILPGF